MAWSVSEESALDSAFKQGKLAKMGPAMLLAMLIVWELEGISLASILSGSFANYLGA